MGAWGIGRYENDDALDWAVALESRGMGAVADALRRVLESDDYLESVDGAAGLAAADVVACLTAPAGLTPGCEQVAAFVQANPGLDASSLIPIAHRAVWRVAAPDSELADLWDETDTGPEWRADLAQLAARLT